VVPGVSSALAVPAYAGIPLTHRNVSSSVTFLTGTNSDHTHDVSTALISLLAAETIVILMGMSNLRQITANLLACGRAPETPVAIIRWGTYETQQTVTGSLQTIADEAESARMRPPGLIIIGEVVRLRERLNWFEKEWAESTEIQERLAEVV
jgi:siroheme synthase